MHPRIHLLRSAATLAILLAPLAAGCLEASPRPAETPDWKRPRTASLDVSDTHPGPSGAAQVDRLGDPFWSACYGGFQLTEDPVSDLDRLGLACGAPRGLGSVSPVHVGAQKAEDPAERLVFRARKGRCYRLFAVGAAGVRDLDVAILAPDGRLIAADLSKDAWSVVPPRGPWCPDEEGPFAIDVSISDGEGAYALGVWGSDL